MGATLASESTQTRTAFDRVALHACGDLHEHVHMSICARMCGSWPAGLPNHVVWRPLAHVYAHRSAETSLVGLATTCSIYANLCTCVENVKLVYAMYMSARAK